VIQERRRSPRYALQAELPAGIPLFLTVQVPEISQGGVLLQSSRPVNVGVRAPLRLTIAGQSFTTEVAVTRVSPSSAAGGYQIGAAFVAIEPEHQELIERFTRE
jgi:hypothetical protein